MDISLPRYLGKSIAAGTRVSPGRGNIFTALIGRHFARKLAADEIRRYMRSVFRSGLMALCGPRAPGYRGPGARGQQGTRRDDCHAGEAALALVGEPIQSHAANS